ncbi:MAG: M20 family metallopeptidase [Promethearchaeota archaeon]|nr:MAG: M20 family metallopeptidase [Candidatus Lokiarchaeota archaeon]
MSEELIFNEIENNRDEYIEFFRELIQTDSYNPPGNEKNVALIIKKYLKKSNIKSDIFPFGDNRANLIAYLKDGFDGRILLYNGHMDVVPPGNEEEWKYPPLSATIKRKKYIYGRGSTDMKGGLAAMVIALKILKKLELEISGNLILNAVADEETGGNYGTKWCIDNELKSIKPHFAIVSEPTRLKPLTHCISVGERGRLVIKIITNGISTHSNWPFMGKNAIYMMSEIIQNLEKIDKHIPKIKPPFSFEELKKLMSVSFPSLEALERVLNEQSFLKNVLKALTQFTKSLTIIKGGIKDNVVPDKCEAYIDFRLLPDQKIEPIINGLKKLIEEDVGYNVKSEPVGDPEEVFVYLENVQYSEPSFWKDWKKSSTLKNFYGIVEKAYNEKPYYFLFPASADTSHLRNDGYCPETIMFGPGSGATAHSTDENIEIEDFINAIKVYTLFAYEFLK